MSAVTVNSETSSASNNAAATNCVICGENSSPKIVKDENFVKMMTLYWEGIQVDVKPMNNKDLGLCAACFYNLKTFYETNDICLYFEENLKEMRRKILRQNLKGIIKRQEENIPLLKIHTQIQGMWGTKLEPTDGNPDFKKYKVTTFIEADKPGDEGDDNSSLEKSAYAIITSEAISQSSKEKERPSSAQKRAQSGNKIRRSKRKTKKSVWSDSSSANTTEELSDSSDF